MRLLQAIQLSEFRTARATYEGVDTTIEQVQDGYTIRYSGKEKQYTTYDALAVFLGDGLNRDWQPVQESEAKQ